MSKALSLLLLVLLPEALGKLGGPSVYDDIAGNYDPTANATTSIIMGKQIERRILKQIDLIGGSGTPPASALPLQVGTRCELALTSPKEYFVPHICFLYIRYALLHIAGMRGGRFLDFIRECDCPMLYVY